MMGSLWKFLLLPTTDWRIGLLCIAVGIYFYLTRNFGYFASFGVKNPQPYPIIGTNYIYFLKHGLTKRMLDYINKYGKVFGLFSGSHPVLVVADLELLKEIFTTNFQSFGGPMVLQTGNKYLDRNIISLHGQEWRRVRRFLTPAFSTGRLKNMVDDIDRCCKELVENVKSKTEGVTEENIKQKCVYYALDVLFSTVFGIVINTQKNPNNLFSKYSKMITKSVEMAFIMVLTYSRSIVCCAKIGINILPLCAIDFFCGIIDKVLNSREHEINHRNDFMALMAKAHKSNMEGKDEKSEKGLDRIDIIASGFAFFFAGYETVSSGIAVCLYHLADNIVWQEKVYQEIQSIISGEEEELKYCHLKEMALLVMCIYESFRLNPPISINNRNVTKDCYLGNIFLKKGTNVIIPIYAIHHHPDYFEDPEKFNPERFTPEENASRHKYAYQPFGKGPRECLGARMAMLEIKMCLVHFLRNFKLSLSDDGKQKLDFHALGVKEAFVTFQPRN